MKIIKERRRLNFVIAAALAVAFLASVVYIVKYYDLQRRYYELLRERAAEMRIEEPR